MTALVRVFAIAVGLVATVAAAIARSTVAKIQSARVDEPNNRGKTDLHKVRSRTFKISRSQSPATDTIGELFEGIRGSL